MIKTTGKIVKYVWRSLLGLLLLIVLCLAVGYWYLGTDSGRRWLAGQASEQLTRELGVPVRVRDAELRFPGRVWLRGLEVKDHHDSLMLRAREVYTSFGYWVNTSGRIALDDLHLDSLYLNLRRYKGEPTSNLGFVIRKLEGTDTTSTGGHTDFIINHILLTHVDFDWNDDKKGFVTDKIDFDHVKVRGLKGDISRLELDGPNIRATLKSLAFRDTTGFVLTDLQTRFSYTKKQMEFSSLHLLTPYSEIGEYLRFDYEDVDKFSEFIDSVQMNGRLRNSRISFKDLAFFTEQLEDKTETAEVRAGTVTGTVRNMKVRDLDLRFGNGNYVQGRTELKGLPNLKETFIMAHVGNARVTSRDLNRLMPEFGIPEIVDRFGVVHMNGNFSGFINDFVADGKFQTDIGDLETDLNLKLTDKPANNTYSGHLKTQNLNLAVLAGQPQLGLVSMNGQIKGQSMELATLRASLKADIQRLDFNRYAYRNLTVDGDVTRKLFSGTLTANDPNFDLGFTGTVNYDRALPEFNFTSDVRYVNLHNLHLYDDTLNFSSQLTLNTRGVTLNEIEGNIIARNTRIAVSANAYNFDSLNLTSLIREHYREINLYSDPALVRLRGDFLPTDLPDLMKTTLNRYVDSSFLKLKARQVNNQYVDFNIQTQDLSLLWDLLNVPMQVPQPASLRGTIHTEGEATLSAAIPEMIYDGVHFSKINLTGNSHTPDGSLEVNLALDSMHTRDSALVSDLKVKAFLNNDHARFNILAADAYREKEAEIKGELDLFRGRAMVQLDTSRVKLMGSEWLVNAHLITLTGDTMVEVPMLTFSQGDQSLAVSGQYSRRGNYPIRIVPKNMLLKTLHTFVPQLRDMTGVLNGQIILENVNTQPVVQSGLLISNLAYQGDTLGHASLASTYDQSTSLLMLDAHLDNRNYTEVLNTHGSVGTDARQALNLQVNLQNTELKTFQPFVDGVFSNMRGTANAALRVTGTMKEPYVKGRIAFLKDTLTIDYLKTSYAFADTVQVNGKVFDLGNITLHDMTGNTAALTGNITLKELDNPYFNLRMDTKGRKLQMMNTTAADNSLYYGLIYGSGYMTLRGTLNDLDLYADVTTEAIGPQQLSEFNLAVTDGSSFAQDSSIRFINGRDTLHKKVVTHTVNTEGLGITINLRVTPDLKGSIIFDPLTRDMIEARATGDLVLKLEKNGDFTIRQTIVITEGTYQFTAYEKLINKNFTITPGSKITFNGDPFDATLDVTAKYTVYNVSTSPLVANLNTQEKETNSRNATVDALLKLSGSLLSPNIYLDFNIQQVSAYGSTDVSALNSVVTSIRNDDQQRVSQVVSLLVLQSFSPVTGFSATEAAGQTLNTTMSEIASSYINQWLRQYVPDLQVGVVAGANSDFAVRLQTTVLNKVNVNALVDLNTGNRNVSAEAPIAPGVNATVRNTTNNNTLTGSYNNVFRAGIGFYKQFDKVSELVPRWMKKLFGKEPKPAPAPAVPTAPGKEVPAAAPQEGMDPSAVKTGR